LVKLCECPAAGGYALRVVKNNQKHVQALGNKFEQVQINKQEFFFTTKALKRTVDELRRVDAAYEEAQAAIVEKALQVAATYHPVIERLTAALATLDVLLALALVAAVEGLRRPVMDAECSRLELLGAKHVLVEAGTGKFIANDVRLSPTERTLVITGPNMGGKSTYIRMTALIAVMAQAGSFVPCTSATLPIFRNVMCRVGASDLQLRGISTFMSEMLEASAILKSVSRDSLVVVDELGRGTSTYDGYGLAYAIAHHLTTVGCFTLFATHFHEMSRLAAEVPGVRNAHMRAAVHAGALTFLYEVADGATDQSYGVEVAAMVRFPGTVLAAAKRKASELGTITGRHLQKSRCLEPHHVTAIERIQQAKSAEEFVSLARQEAHALRTLAA